MEIVDLPLDNEAGISEEVGAYIRAKRKEVGWSQTDLANAVESTQSNIARIEKGETNPGIRIVMKILIHIENERIKDKGANWAEALMEEKVVYAYEGQIISELIPLMKEKGISQLPVSRVDCSLNEWRKVRVEYITGTLTDNDILDHLEHLETTLVKDAMSLKSLPMLPKHASFESIEGLARRNPAVLITDDGKVIGIVTKADILQKSKWNPYVEKNNP